MPSPPSTSISFSFSSPRRPFCRSLFPTPHPEREGQPRSGRSAGRKVGRAGGQPAGR
jgi:hypothetical protein